MDFAVEKSQFFLEDVFIVISEGVDEAPPAVDLIAPVVTNALLLQNLLWTGPGLFKDGDC